jgi:hypothetical protein
MVHDVWAPFWPMWALDFDGPSLHYGLMTATGLWTAPNFSCGPDCLTVLASFDSGPSHFNVRKILSHEQNRLRFQAEPVIIFGSISI